MTDKFARHSELVNQMSRKAGVDLGRRVVEGTLVPEAVTGVVDTCCRCGSVSDCEAHLQAVNGDGVGVPDYCLNSALFGVLEPE